MDRGLGHGDESGIGYGEVNYRKNFVRRLDRNTDDKREEGKGIKRVSQSRSLSVNPVKRTVF